ncbi:MAG: cytochrome c-type biogenesis protein CcmH [Gammaproteobacteria bacterium]|nr:cytochrome c-type biogenesis protein CcmH [Gammaproteobacteria bacterium]
MKVKVIFILLAILMAGFLLIGPAFASEAKLNEDPEIKERFKHLASELRCLKCQNQTIWDSKAGLADDLRKQIRTQIYAGKSDDEIVEYMVDRYGDFVRYKPAVDMKNLFLWVGPFIFMIVGGLLLIRYVKIRRTQTEEDNDTISDEDRLRAQSILKQGGDK